MMITIIILSVDSLSMDGITAHITRIFDSIKLSTSLDRPNSGRFRVLKIIKNLGFYVN